MVFFLPKKEKSFFSKIHGTIEVKKRYGQKSVITGSITQSGGELIAMWDKLLKNIKKEDLSVSSFLVLGIGGGTIFKLVKKQFPKARLIGVELDSVMINIAKKEYDLCGAKLIHADAIKWVKQKNLENSFDLIIMDLCVGRKNPNSSQTTSFLRNLKRITKKNGAVFYNALYNKEEEPDYWEFKKRCEILFSTVDEVFTYPLNHVLYLKK